ncbi:hypothetical protein [Nocardioides sp. MH1]|uniref:hypothetical protein n=1 Tax=Nocardioides sp. MH1 TaxID=3242490 RepID=UPI0035226F02
MGCCIALAAAIALVRRGWWRVTGHAPAPAVFAPPARRPAPGSLAPAAGVAIAVPAPAPALATALVTCGLAWFVVGVVGMHALGWFTWAEGSVVSDTAFHASGLWLAAAGALVAVVRA